MPKAAADRSPMRQGPVNLFSPRAVSALLQRHGVRTNKSLGQNFLLDKNTLERIVAPLPLVSRPTENGGHACKGRHAGVIAVLSSDRFGNDTPVLKT